MEKTKREKIAELNDKFRSTLPVGQVHITQGVYTLGYIKMNEIVERVKTFGNFNNDNDPNKTHDL